MSSRFLKALVALSLGFCLSVGDSASSMAAPPPDVPAMQLTVDAREAGVGRLHNHLVLPVRPGELRLFYAKWVPGEHGPTGPINEMVGLRMTAGGKPVPWRRSAEDVYAIDVTVPAGVTSLAIDSDTLRSGAGLYSGAAASTSQLVDVVWNHAFLYPKGPRASAIMVEPTVVLPKGWTYATALPGAREHDGSVSFGKVSLETLVDSPLLAGAHGKTFDLGMNHGVAHSLSAFAESDAPLAAPDEEVAGWKRLIVEANALFGARHYDSYRFLIVLNDHVPSFGLEHHQSSEDYMQEGGITDAGLRRLYAGLLSHEYVHSWNGKYRRPRGLATPNFQEPMHGDLLWIYEGLTEYLGWVLSVRSGMESVDDAKSELTDYALRVDNAGRAWRPLVDTAVSAQLLNDASSIGATTRRQLDYYPEGALLWLEADVLIRQKTNGARSLDDFCQRFHGGKDSSAEVNPYDLDDVVKTLAAVAPNDWKAFFDERIYRVAPKVPLGGVEGAGYKLGFATKKPDRLGVREHAGKVQSYWQTLGFYLDEENSVGDVDDGSPASKAGLTARSKVLAVNGRKVSPEVMASALAHAKTAPEPIELIVERDGNYRTLKVDYHGGERYAVLERDPGKPDLLAAILAPKAASALPTATTTPPSTPVAPAKK